MKYKIWLTKDYQKVLEIPKTSVSNVEFGMKSDDVQQLKFVLNLNNLGINNHIIKPNTILLLEIGTARLFFYIAKYERNESSYNVNCVVDYYQLKWAINPLQNQTYTGTLSELLSQIVPNFVRNQINGQDANISISVGTDDIMATLKKAMTQANYRWRITSYNSQNKPIIEYGNPALVSTTKAQFSNYSNISSFGERNLITSLSLSANTEYISSYKVSGKYDGGSNPEFDFINYNSTDTNFPVMQGNIIDQSQNGKTTKIVVKKFTIPATIPVGNQSKDYLYQLARDDLIDNNSKLIDYTIEVQTNKYLQPLDKIFIHYNDSIQNLSGVNVKRISDTKVISGIQYNLDSGKVGLTLTSTGKFTLIDQTFEIQKQLKALTQST